MMILMICQVAAQSSKAAAPREVASYEQQVPVRPLALRGGGSRQRKTAVLGFEGN